MAKYIKLDDAIDAIMEQFCASSDETEFALNNALEALKAKNTIEIETEEYEQLTMVINLPVSIGTKIRDKIADCTMAVYKIELFEINGEPRVLFRCSNDGTEDYMAVYLHEIPELYEIVE